MKKTIYSQREGSHKFLLPCKQNLDEDPGWLKVQRFLHTKKEYNILVASIRNYKEVIVKFGDRDIIVKEYALAKEACEYGVPNFIKFLCSFPCADTEEDIKVRDFTKNSQICNGSMSDPTLGVIIMPFYPLGNLGNYRWTRGDFKAFKSVLQQVAFALLDADKKFGFVHGDLHLGNVLVRNSKKKEIIYTCGTAQLYGFYAIIMDFGLSHKTESPYLVYKNIERILSLSRSIDTSDLALDIDTSLLFEYMSEDRPIDNDVYQGINNIIDNIRIRHVHSEVAHKNWR